ncbi:PAS domain S-box protein [Jeotgalibacillus sp. ET6]|uniref:two-component system sensor histidine kinase NtrB n=1 Tax=Jeotgalibacillus sp. ET6 TaxID=3037260 RepID=UPI002418777F|nr:ATP-binding protein [Jeotgalibacillus sp. ET6]MDG5471942.1 PAS domain S-box protein [Jeotgalibacillus sp. ET6]
MEKTFSKTDSAKSQQEMYRDILEYSVENIMIHTNFKVLYVNEACSRFLRCSKESAKGACVLELFEEETKKLIQTRIEETMNGTQKPRKTEETITRFDGSRIDVELHCNPVMYGNQKAIQSVFRDITKRKEAERWMKDQDKLASVGQIAAGIAHEVKNPLTAVKGFLQLLEESHPHAYLTTMKSELNIAINTLTNLLHVSKPDLYEEEIVPIYLCKELDALLLLFQDRFYDIKVELHLKDTCVFILGKRNLFLKAFFNLFKNAIEAIEGSGKITIEHYVHYETVHVKMHDTGVGIPKDKINLLGTPFYTSKSQGTGLGLTQVFTTIIDHGGTLTVHSHENCGTTFHIQLPTNQSVS